jgi:hypothetical protein
MENNSHVSIDNTNTLLNYNTTGRKDRGYCSHQLEEEAVLGLKRQVIHHLGLGFNLILIPVQNSL